MTPTEIESVAAFRQFDRDKHEQQGLGLGLAIVTHVAALHHAPLTLEAGPEGVGLHAMIELRLAD
jgi:two-component system sensor histidine kinase/response regulator